MQNRQLAVVSNIQSVIRDFDGNESPEIAKAWITELKNVKAVNDRSDAVAFNAVKGHLKGAAFK